MLNDKEKRGFREILEHLSEDDLVSLKDTVTNRLIAARNRQEAIHVILTYTADAFQLLKRKKLKRDVIFQYLANHGIAVSPNADKQKLIRTVLTYWDTNIADLQNFDDSDDDLPIVPVQRNRNVHIQEIQIIEQPPPRQPAQREPRGARQPREERLPRRDHVQEVHIIEQPPPRQPAQEVQREPRGARQPRVERRPRRDHIQEVYILEQPPPQLQAQEVQIAYHNRNNEPNLHIAEAVPLQPPVVAPPVSQQLAIQFVTWFFRELNSLSPHAIQRGATSDWGPHHFFSNCKLRMNIHTDEMRKEAFETSETVSKRFRALVETEGLLFNPNTDEGGTKGVDDPHGLVLVFVCGTIHNDGMCLGVFEQRFGLARDPLSQNNYKIKFTDLNVRSEAVNQTPKLESTSNFPAITDS